MRHIVHSLAIGMIVSMTATALPAADSMTDDEADSALERMAEQLVKSQKYSVTLHMGYDAVQASGQKIEFSEVRKVQVARPNKLRVDFEQSDGDAGTLIFDGSKLTLFNARANVYSQVPVAGDIDAAVRYAVGTMSMRVPLARMLTTTLPDELEKLTTEINYVEKNSLGPVPTHHIAARSADVDYQVWVAADGKPLPQRIVLSYRTVPGDPQFWGDFTEWNLAPVFAADTFTFTAPKGAELIPALIPAAAAQAAAANKPGAIR